MQCKWSKELQKQVLPALQSIGAVLLLVMMVLAMLITLNGSKD